ncbi:hypothetical protein, partial [Geobacter sp. OR-1]|uniref:hypothetical protein n=1 Tax=Geobacter sp. OR-1 TaxID=1266765 RepID=UPI001ED9C21A
LARPERFELPTFSKPELLISLSNCSASALNWWAFVSDLLTLKEQTLKPEKPKILYQCFPVCLPVF